jgi:hypothetical protein
MTLNANEPTDQRMVSELPYYIRRITAALNAHLTTAGNDYTITELAIVPDTTTLYIDQDLTDIWIESVLITSGGPSTIENILYGRTGQIKMFMAANDEVSFRDGVQSGGQIYLNQTPLLSVFSMQTNDILTLMNIDGDGQSEPGYWTELWRVCAVK